MFLFRKQKTNYGKIFAIVVGAVALVGAVAFLLYKFFGNRCLCESDYCDDYLDECDCCNEDDCDCEECVSEDETVKDAE